MSEVAENTNITPDKTSAETPAKKKFNSELSFLLDLLLNEKLTKSVKEKITDRVRDVEALMQARPIMVANPMPLNGPSAPLTFHPTAGNMPPNPPQIQQGSTVNPNQGVASNGHAVQNAMMERQRLLSQGEKPAPGETGPRKFRGGL